MKPESKFVDDGDHHHHHQKLGKPSMPAINGQRPSPLKIHQDSHTIHKTTPPNSSSITIPPPHHQHQQQQQQRKPVIIYAHSPRVIHTQPRDFMALVQKLTGVSRYDDDEENEQSLVEDGHDHHRQHHRHNNDVRGYGDNFNNESSSVVTDDKDGGGDMRETTSSSSPLFNAPPGLNPYLADIPLFTPNSSDYFCSSTTRPLFRFSDMLSSSSPSMGNSSLSPSFLEAMKRLPEY